MKSYYSGSSLVSSHLEDKVSRPIAGQPRQADGSTGTYLPQFSEHTKVIADPEERAAYAIATLEQWWPRVAEQMDAQQRHAKRAYLLERAEAMWVVASPERAHHAKVLAQTQQREAQFALEKKAEKEAEVAARRRAYDAAAAAKAADTYGASAAKGSAPRKTLRRITAWLRPGQPSDQAARATPRRSLMLRLLDRMSR